jgi:hypothetical protein
VKLAEVSPSLSVFSLRSQRLISPTKNSKTIDV